MTTVGIIGSGMIGDAADAGSLAGSWHQEPGTPVYGTPYGPFPDEAGTPAGAAKIHAALADAARTRAAGDQPLTGFRASALTLDGL